MIKGLNYTTHCLWFSYKNNGDKVGQNIFGDCSMYVRDHFEQYDTLDLYIPDDYLKDRYSTEYIKKYLAFLEKCGFIITYEGISEDWKAACKKYAPEANAMSYARGATFIRNEVFHKFVFKKTDYKSRLHIMGAFVCLRYLYCSYFEGLVEDIMKIKDLFPRTNPFKVLLLAHYSPTYRKEPQKRIVSKWGLIGLYNKYGKVTPGAYSTPILGSKAFKLITIAQFLKNTAKLNNNLNGSATILIEDILIEDLTKLFKQEDYTKIKKLLK
jgi:hypothetical protein